MSNATGKTVLVTGASSGIGKATAKTLAEDGYIVYAAARNTKKMDDLEALGCIPLKMDITKDEDVIAVVDRITGDHGGVDILINNAGFGLYGAIEDTSLDDARYQFEVNLFGLARLTQLLLPYMREKKEGKIINMSSMGGKIYTPLGGWYYATKHALEGWSDCLRLEAQQFGIDVVIIEPGIIQTDFGDVMTGPMLERSGHGPYAKLASALARVQNREYEKGSGSPPQVIADLILKAVRSGKPNTRYAGGKYAALLLFMRKWLSDRAFDRIVMSMIK